MNTDSPNSSALNERRRLAVKLRLEGRKLKEITELVDLSSPTIIAAHKQFLKGGWAAVDVKPRGRPSGNKAMPTEALETLRKQAFEAPPHQSPWSLADLAAAAKELHTDASVRTVGKYLEQWGLSTDSLYKTARADAQLKPWLNSDYKTIVDSARKTDSTIYWAGLATCQDQLQERVRKFMYAHTTKGQYFWLAGDYDSDADRFIDFFERLATQKSRLSIIWHGHDPALTSETKSWLDENINTSIHKYPKPVFASDDRQQIAAQHSGNTWQDNKSQSPKKTQRKTNPMSLTHLQHLEAESIHIMREAIAAADKPAMLYSAGKDSSVMLHLAQKAFYPAKPPFPLLHIDTGWKFKAMYEFRDMVAEESGLQLIVHKNIVGIDKGVNPFTHGAALHTEILKTEALKQALDKHGFDITFAGARRDEEKSRAKERVMSFRTDQHRWDPRNQRPELWNLYNTNIKAGESIRAFPLSNWTELDIWKYIHHELISVPPLYFSAERPVVPRDGTWIMVDDNRMPMNKGETPIMKPVRFRTLGCYPLTGAIESNATNTKEVIQEILLSNHSERQGRMIDQDSAASIEKKKQEGYF